MGSLLLFHASMRGWLMSTTTTCVGRGHLRLSVASVWLLERAAHTPHLNVGALQRDHLHVHTRAQARARDKRERGVRKLAAGHFLSLPLDSSGHCDTHDTPAAHASPRSLRCADRRC